jgi:hypothetical protein
MRRPDEEPEVEVEETPEYPLVLEPEPVLTPPPSPAEQGFDWGCYATHDA